MKTGKRTLLAILLALCLTMAAAAAPAALTPVGRCVGITLRTEGVTVIGFAEDGSAARDAGIRQGDRILAIDGTPVDSPEGIRALLRPGERVVLRVQRGGRESSYAVLVPQQAELGVLVRDGISGIGTVTFYDPQTGLYGALGHGVSDSGGMLPQVAEGRIVPAAVAGVTPGQPGQPGTLRGAYEDRTLGNIERNTDRGIFGRGVLPEAGEPLPLGTPHLGEASIRANVSGEEVAEYQVRILDLDPGANTRNFLVQVTDARLLEATGGIVQGMSGSPVLQDGKLVGAVTHVLVNDPTMGYGIFIENMLDAAG